MREFVDFPYSLYRNELNWIPPLRLAQKALFDFKKNPFWKTGDHSFFLALDGERIVGRIATIIHNEYNQINKTNTGFFGFLEAENNQEIFRSLLNTAEKWLMQHGCNKVIGPVNPSINYEVGILIEGFHLSPKLMMTYNFPYYPKNIESCGYSKEMDFFAYYTGKDAPTLSEKADRIIELTRKRYDLKLRPVRKKNFRSELRILHQIYNDAFSGHYGFVPMSEEEFAYMGKDMAQIVDEDLLLIAEYGGEPIAFILALPDYNEVFSKIRNGKLFPFGWITFLRNKNRIESIRILTIAVKEKYRHLGIGAYLYKEILDQTIKKKIHHGEMSWVAEDNVQMNKATIEMGAVLNKKYRLYQKKLG